MHERKTSHRRPGGRFLTAFRNRIRPDRGGRFYVVLAATGLIGVGTLAVAANAAVSDDAGKPAAQASGVDAQARAGAAERADRSHRTTPSGPASTGVPPVPGKPAAPAEQPTKKKTTKKKTTKKATKKRARTTARKSTQPARKATRKPATRKATPRVASRAAWVNPMPAGAVTSCFGPRWGTMHAGVDLAAPSGTPIRAAGGGTVVDAGWAYSGYGISVMIRHSNGYLTHYAHMSRTAVQPGERVSAGQVIGYEGSTGDSTGPHLHFEVHSGMWNQVEPASWMRARGVSINGC